MGRHILEPLAELCAFGLGQAGQVQLILEPAGAGRVDALRVFVPKAQGCIQRVDRGTQFGIRVMSAVGGKKEFVIADIAAPAAELAGLVMPERDPERIIGQLLQTMIVDLRCGIQRGTGTERQVGKAFEHGGQLLSDNGDEAREYPLPEERAGLIYAAVAYLARRASPLRIASVLACTSSAVTSALLKICWKCSWVTAAK